MAECVIELIISRSAGYARLVTLLYIHNIAVIFLPIVLFLFHAAVSIHLFFLYLPDIKPRLLRHPFHLLPLHHSFT